MTDPLDFDRVFGEAKAAYQGGRFDQAEGGCQRILQVEPRHLAAKALLGLVAGQTGRPKWAIELLSEVIAQEPNSWGPLNALAILLRQEGDLAGAVSARQRALQLKPQDPVGHYDLGLCFLSEQRVGEAAQCFYRSLALAPNQAGPYAGLSVCMASVGKLREAAEYRRKAYEADPNSVAGNLEMARALIEDSRHDEAEQFARRALQIDPNAPDALLVLGEALQGLGRFQEAEEPLGAAIRIQPRSTLGFLMLTGGRKLADSDRPLVEQMAGLFREGGLSNENTMYLHYALGKAFDDLKEFGSAMSHYDEANRLAERALRLAVPPFDVVHVARSYDDLISTYSKEFFSQKGAAGSESEAPVLIVGMMRSGTTLVEQIVSSHSDVEAGGELKFWVQAKQGNGHLANEYLKLLTAIGPGKSRVTDKNPENFEQLGLIHACFPYARIVHCRRHPIDNCLSIYMTRDCNPAYAHNRENIASMYEQYRRLMAHWRQVLPPDRFLEVDYEELVADRENQTRRLISFCGLDWQDACLRHELNERAVATPSLWQVRQPIYRTSVARWKNYEPWIGSFRRLLEQGS